MRISRNSAKTDSAILFPHCFATETDIRRAVSLFHSLAIGLPWFLDAPDFLPSCKEADRLRVIRPPAVEEERITT